MYETVSSPDDLNHSFVEVSVGLQKEVNIESGSRVPNLNGAFDMSKVVSLAPNNGNWSKNCERSVSPFDENYSIAESVEQFSDAGSLTGDEFLTNLKKYNLILPTANQSNLNNFPNSVASSKISAATSRKSMATTDRTSMVSSVAPSRKSLNPPSCGNSVAQSRQNVASSRISVASSKRSFRPPESSLTNSESNNDTHLSIFGAAMKYFQAPENDIATKSDNRSKGDFDSRSTCNYRSTPAEGSVVSSSKSMSFLGNSSKPFDPNQYRNNNNSTSQNIHSRNREGSLHITAASGIKSSDRSTHSPVKTDQTHASATNPLNLSSLKRSIVSHQNSTLSATSTIKTNDSYYSFKNIEQASEPQWFFSTASPEKKNTCIIGKDQNKEGVSDTKSVRSTEREDYFKSALTSIQEEQKQIDAAVKFVVSAQSFESNESDDEACIEVKNNSKNLMTSPTKEDITHDEVKPNIQLDPSYSVSIVPEHDNNVVMTSFDGDENFNWTVGTTEDPLMQTRRLAERVSKLNQQPSSVGRRRTQKDKTLEVPSPTRSPRRLARERQENNQQQFPAGSFPTLDRYEIPTGARVMRESGRPK